MNQFFNKKITKPKKKIKISYIILSFSFWNKVKLFSLFFLNFFLWEDCNFIKKKIHSIHLELKPT